MLNSIGALSVLAGVASALVIAWDFRKRKQPMKIMYPVWVLTGLWAPVLSLWAYFTFGRGKIAPRRTDTTMPEGKSVSSSMTMEMPGMTMHSEPGSGADMAMKRMDPGKGTGMQGVTVDKLPVKESGEGMDMHPGMNMDKSGPGMQMDPGMKMPEGSASSSSADMSGVDMAMKRMDPDMRMDDMGAGAGMGMDISSGKSGGRPGWRSVTLSTLHCGAGCTLADLTGEWFAFFVPVVVGGSLVLGSWVLDYGLALCFGIFFQYAAIRSMQRVTAGEAVRKAAKADFLSLTAWQVGMYGWMALVLFVFFPDGGLSRLSFAFWLMMQVAMLAGFLVAWPVNVWLIRKGIKSAM